MKFNKHLSPEICKVLESQYREYIKTTKMSKKERRALRDWVKEGHSVYENTCEAWANGLVPIEFLAVYREEEYLRKKTKGMSPEDARRFVLNYYGMESGENSESIINYQPVFTADGEELPF